MSTTMSAAPRTHRRRLSSLLSSTKDRDRTDNVQEIDSSRTPTAKALHRQSYFDRYPKAIDSPELPQDDPIRTSTKHSFEASGLPEAKGVSRDNKRPSSSNSLSFPSIDSANKDMIASLMNLTPKRHSRLRTRSGSSRRTKSKDLSPVPPLRYSGSTQNETPPPTPVDFDFSAPPRSVQVAAPIAGIHFMDALVDGMNKSGSRGAASRSRFGIPGHHPLYEPPLPAPPPGVVLGGSMIRMPERPVKNPNRLSHSLHTGEEEADVLPKPRGPRRRAHRPPSSRAGSNSTITSPHSRSHSVVEDDVQVESAAAVHQHFSLSQKREKSIVQSAFRDSGFDETVPSPASRIRDEVMQRSASSPPAMKTIPPSISEIIRKHAPQSAHVRARPSTSRSASYAPGPTQETVQEEQESEPEPLTAVEEAEFLSRSSIDSIADEVRRTVKNQTKSPITHVLHHAHSFPNRASSVLSDNASVRSPPSDAIRDASIYSSSSTNHPSSPFDSPALSYSSRPSPQQVIAQYLRSKRLTTLLKLTRTPHASREQPLTVSLSDMGDPNGFPLVVFLGLGCVRHIMGLYDEMADCLGLRLITIDRWGLGRTREPNSRAQRGIMVWAGVVEEVLDQLKIGRCSVMAHSAGAPYALSFANLNPQRIIGDVCLLAPWVGGGEGAGYKWLKYVPNGLLKTAQAAEWKVQAWMIGKPPAIAYEGIGYDAKTASTYSPSSKSRGTSSRQDSALKSVYPSPDQKSRKSTGSRSIGSSVFSEYDDLKDFDGCFDSRSTLGNISNPRESQYSNGSAGTETTKKRKIGRVILTKLRAASASHSPSPSPDEKSPNPARRLKALRSMGSLKSKAAQSLSRQSTPPSPQTPVHDGLIYNKNGWDRSISTDSCTDPSSREQSPYIGSKSPPLVGQRAGGRRSVSFSTTRSSPASIAPSYAGSQPPSVPPSPQIGSFEHPFSSITGGSYQARLGSALIAASHAESAKGTHSDLLQILNHDHQPWGFSYSAYPHKVNVWYGDRDEKIAENAVRWMERNMGSEWCSVKVVKGADHSLMYKSSVVVEVLEKVREFW